MNIDYVLSYINQDIDKDPQIVYLQSLLDKETDPAKRSEIMNEIDKARSRFTQKRAAIMTESSRVASLQELLKFTSDQKKRSAITDEIAKCQARIYYIMKTE